MFRSATGILVSVASIHSSMSDMITNLEHQAEPVPNGPHNPDEINPKIAADIHYWAKEFEVSGQLLHEAIRVHGTKVEKVRAALKHHQVNMPDV